MLLELEGLQMCPSQAETLLEQLIVPTPLGAQPWHGMKLCPQPGLQQQDVLGWCAALWQGCLAGGCCSALCLSQTVYISSDQGVTTHSHVIHAACQLPDRKCNAASKPELVLTQ